MSISHRRLTSVLVVLALAGPAAVASAQVFGKNKVHYEALHWAVLETPHLRLHYYGTASVARGRFPNNPEASS